MVGVEALLRWTHATRGAIQPTTFIPIAEQMGLMDTIGAFVLHRTLQDAAGSRDNTGRTLQSIARPHWVDNVVRISAHAGFAQAATPLSANAERTHPVR
jgi:EAL domain-containing protein (putative c-di-GMP-specific phosphodiesterase class I)